MNGSGICELLPWDTEFFGFQVARSRKERVTAAEMEDLLTACMASNVRCLYLLADPSDAVTLELLERHGFHFRDLRLTLINTAPAAFAAEDSAIREAQPGDLPELFRIARESHRDSRFYFDGKFPRERCDELYEIWLRRSITTEGQTVLSAEIDGRPSGYIACSMAAPSRGQIQLFAVGPDARGRGLGGRLIRAAFQWFTARGADHVITVTQGRNIGAVRTYERSGFVAESLRLWYHRWF